MIDSPQADATAIVPFHLWADQLRLLWAFLAERLVIILKARQLGISWLACAYALWTCLFQGGRLVLLFSKGQLEADELLRRVRVLYERLPLWMRETLPALTRQNLSELAWDNGSAIKSLPATQHAGRTFTASLVIGDEFAFMQYADELYTAIKPTIDGGGQMILLSTANGQDNLFAKLWDAAMPHGSIKSLNHFKAIFLPWRSRPERDDAWRARVEAEATFSWQTAQEYPGLPTEAFQNTGNERFLQSMLWWDACQEILPALNANEPMVLALDAGVNNDSFAISGVTRHPARHDDVAIRYAREWKPPKSGSIDYAPIYDEVKRLCEAFNVVQATYDPYQLHMFATQLQSEGVVMTSAFDQGKERLTADKQFLDLITQRHLAHDGNAVLRDHIDHADKKPDDNKLRIVKRSPDLKIDLAVASSMATFRCLRLPL